METFKKLKQYYWPFKHYFIWSIFFLFIVTAITVVYPMILQVTIDEVIIGGNYGWIPYLALGFIAIMAVKGAATYIHQYTGDLFGITSVYKLRNVLYEKLQFLPFRYYDNAKTGDLMSRLTADVEGFRFFLSFGFSELIRFCLLILISMSVMFYYSVPLAIVTLITLPFLAVVTFKFDKAVHPAFRGIRKSFGRLNTKVQENISGINTVKSLSREDFEINKFNGSNSDYRDKYLFTSDIWAKYFPLMEFLGNLSVVLLLAYGGYLVMAGSLNPGELVAFYSLVWYIMWPIMNLGFIVNLFSQSKASGERLIEILEADNEIEDTDSSVHTERLQGEVEFRNVTLKYTKDDNDALSNISFHAEPGKVIGLIGSTGSGKTSLTQLMTRFYEPVEGNVMIDGINVQDYSLQSLRSNISFVLQESFLFSSSIKANIAFGKPDSTMEEIIEAAKRAQAHEFIMELPDQYDTVLGERGMGLSGGQKQRIAIARAICADPSILVLDDATSAVDMETEFRIQKALREVMADRTTFIIAHRISSLKHADEILVLESGRVAERGTHEKLLKNNGPYQRIYDIQYQDRDKVLQSNAG
ncbi:ABC transporter ATP-binding protein [Cytobacillus firmus]|uniref:ABC transporter ATP-binding protein/permease n=1 Tax=Cytobacillus firmus TaxID=1399 RepID=A0AA46SKI7_CYTFI|nr:ABC transporter ATP-binding protein [Cytobacillus firmus]KML39718.1 multidrug ABC transporter ATP-binding protein [Cytobacillus firmus]MBG9443489.1 multidrug ABC transporter ATP-binding protein [Cytobacillus firmus]MCS0652117.1 ABC transporter ATP-binding protein/permease [Cytobacillus firmus]UYG96560.1 ABC transporter ATP-binding protein/permease [Cytobacillus firmus]WHY35730.1 ABC transporter ATP-binding protein [Cytobacillus firmus]